ncbi:hypothetical protein F5Y10DRAFT_235937 [Nemania abortiva]|nr:hypothetical protein F5Y10DRAFT_235937 [Nemania abortiva]
MLWRMATYHVCHVLLTVLHSSTRQRAKRSSNYFHTIFRQSWIPAHLFLSDSTFCQRTGNVKSITDGYLNNLQPFEGPFLYVYNYLLHNV